MKMEYRSIEKITPYGNNPRKNDKAVDAVAASIQDFGFKVPIVVDKNGVIVTGHTRLKAAQKLGLKEVPVIVADDLTPEQIKAFRLADNRVSEIATWDEEALQAELEQLEAMGVNMLDFGFTKTDLAELGEVDEVEPDEDTEPISKEGELWQLGEHRLLIGDCTDPAQIDKLMQGEQLALLMTDPPYGVDYESDAGKVHNDGLATLPKLLFDSFTVANKVMKPGAAFYIWHANSNSYIVESAVEATREWTMKQAIIWVKNSATLGRQDYQWQHEPCLYGWKSGASHYFTFDRTSTTVIDDNRKPLNKMSKQQLRQEVLRLQNDKPTTVLYEDKPSRSEDHPTMKPIRLLARLIANSSRRGELVGDFFGGSGSTLIACEQLGRRCYTMELDPKYADVIIARWEKLTGMKAEKLNGSTN